MGLDSYSPLSTANSTTSNSECTKGYNAAYRYYTSNAKRIKYQMYENGTLTTKTTYYWERSRSYHKFYSAFTCTVNTEGEASGLGSGDYGLAPAFVIGN